MLAATLTALYANWSKEGLQNISALHMWAILILVWALILHLLVYVDREIRRVQKTRKVKKARRIRIVREMEGEDANKKTSA